MNANNPTAGLRLLDPSLSSLNSVLQLWYRLPALRSLILQAIPGGSSIVLEINV